MFQWYKLLYYKKNPAIYEMILVLMFHIVVCVFYRCWRLVHTTSRQQGATVSPNIPPPLLKVLWPRVGFLRIEHYPPWQLNLAVDQAEPSALAAQDLAMIRQFFNIMAKGCGHRLWSRELLVELKLEKSDLI